MNLSIKAAVGIALLCAASMSAFATSVTPPATGPTPEPGLVPGGLVIEVWDATTGTSMSEWLGGDISTFGGPTSVAAGGVTLDYGVLGGSATFSSLFSASEIAAGNVHFVVSAANDVTPSAPTIDFTASALTTIRGSGVGGFASANNTGISATMNGSTACNNVNPCTATSTTAPGFAVNNLGTPVLATGTKTAGTVGGGAINFYQIVSTGSASGVQTPVQFANATGAATWTLSSNGDLVFSAPGASAVPLPAAVWLLGSGILGLFGIGRRRIAQAA